jgi:hypothetical protein
MLPCRENARQPRVVCTEAAWSATVTLLTRLAGRDAPFLRQDKLKRAPAFFDFLASAMD